jgi:hypothetical protein
VADVSNNSSSNFVQGIKMGLPVFGMFESAAGREDAVSRLTGTPIKGTDTVAKVFGSLLPGAALAGAGAAGLKVAKGASKDGAGKIAKALASNKGKAGLIAATVLGAVGIGTAVVKNLAGNKQRHDA